MFCGKAWQRGGGESPFLLLCVCDFSVFLCGVSFILNKALTLLQVKLILHLAGKTCKSAGVCENLASRSYFYSCFTFPRGQPYS